MVKIGIIGYGYWGPNLVRNFSATNDCEVAMVSDLRTEKLSAIGKLYPSIRTTSDPKEILNNSSIDAVVIATPVFSHYQLAKDALNNDKHVLIEKPMCTTSVQAEELIFLAKKKGKVLMVDHTYLYTGAVAKMKSMMDEGKIGKITYFDSTRINLGLFQHDVNVLWDLAPHDISILTHLIPEKPVSINATGVSHTPNGIENIAYLTVNFQSGLIAHFNCSWSSPVKIRFILVGGSEKMIEFNDLSPSEKVKIYDTGYSVKTSARPEEELLKSLIDYRVGDVFMPKLENREALSFLAKDFISAVRSGSAPLSTGELGLQVVKILEAAQLSIKNKGKEIIL